MKKLLTILFTFCFLQSITASDIDLENITTSAVTLGMYSRTSSLIPITGNIEQLKYFFEALKQARSKKLRIAHFGDSLIMGDIITGDLRALYQGKYGGRGIGFMSPCNDDIMLRYTISHRFSDNWDWASVFTRNPKRYPLNIGGIMSVPSSSSTVSYEANRIYENSKEFKEVRIFYDKSNPLATVEIKTENDQTQLSLPEAEGVFNEVNYTSTGNINGVSLKFENNEGSYIYGISLENGPGVYVDNFAMRGNSGASLSKLNEKFLTESQEALNYKLMVFNYGINIAEAGKTDYTWYKKKMIRIIEKFKKMYPETSMLLISAGDKAIKKGSRLISDSIVPVVVEVQKEIAMETGIAFWNLSDVINSDGGIVNWVDRGLVSKDYIHFNQKGGQYVAEKLMQALEEASKK